MINAKDFLGRSPLHYHILFGNYGIPQWYRHLERQGQQSHVMKYDPGKWLQWFAKIGADFGITDHLNCTPLHYAVVHYRTSVPLLALLRNSDWRSLIHAKDRYGNTPLHHSAERGVPKITELLMKYGAKEDSRNDLQMLPLHSAAAYNRDERTLTALKVDPDQVETIDTSGRSPLVLAILTGQINAARLLLRSYEGLDSSSNPQVGPLKDKPWVVSELSNRIFLVLERPSPCSITRT